MITIVSRETAAGSFGRLGQMHRLRKQVFNDRLGWSVPVSGDVEVDEHDGPHAVYVLSERAGEVEGSVRLLPTLGSYLLRDTFPELLGGAPAPASPLLWEASRFAVRKSALKRPDGLAQATYELLIGVLDVALAAGVEAILCCLDLRMERVLRRAGWPLHRLGAVCRIGNTLALAGRLEVDEQVRRAIQRRAAFFGTPAGAMPIILGREDDAEGLMALPNAGRLGGGVASAGAACGTC